MRSVAPLHSIPPTSELSLGVDLGGTKIEAIVTRTRGGGEATGLPEILSRVRIPTRREEGYDHIVAAVAALIEDAARGAGVNVRSGAGASLPIGVGMPGSVTWRDPDGSPSPRALVKNSNTTCLNGRPFRSDLIERVGAPITFANDANCFALAEATCGAAREARVAFGVILGTGVGGGIVFRMGEDGRAVAWDGAQGIAGEWGHVSLEPVAGPRCYCGRRGCVEQFLSGPAIEERYRLRTGRAWSVAQIAKARGDDPDASTTIADMVERFGRAVATVVNVLDPDVVVLGGGVSNLAILYDEGVDAVRRWVFNDDLRTKIVRNVLGDNAGVIGAAMLPAAASGGWR